MKIDKHPLAINILKYQAYNFELFSCQEIVLFETLVVLGGISFSKREEFFHSTQTLMDKSGIKRHTVDKTLNRFVDLGIIEFQIKGMPRVKYISIIWDKILELLPQIYQFDEFIKLFNGTTKPLYDFFNQLAENNKKLNENDKEKNIIKNIKEEYTEEENKEEWIAADIASEEETTAIKDFKHFIENLFKHTDTPRKGFENKDLIQALEYYSLEEIKEYATHRNHRVGYFDMRKFFKFSESGRMIRLEEFYQNQVDQVNRFIDRLKDVFQARIGVYNNENDDYKEKTPLPVKQSVLNKMHKALNVKDKIEIKHAFIAYADDILYMRVKPKLDALSYFLKEENGEYPVIDNYQLKFISEYKRG